jgi:hypothetical protein
MNRVIQPKVKVTLVQGETFNVTIGRAAWEACSATWNLGTNSAFALGPRNTTENLDRVGRPHDLSDVNYPGLNPWTLTLVPNLCCCFFFVSFFPPTSCFIQLFVCAYDLDKHQTVYNTYVRIKGICEQISIQINIHYIHVNLWLSLNLGVYCSLEKWCFTRCVAYPITETMFHSKDQTSQLNCKLHYEYTTAKLVWSFLWVGYKRKHFPLHFSLLLLFFYYCSYPDNLFMLCSLILFYW